MSTSTSPINDLAAECHQIAREKGWWDRERPFPEQIALMHSELSEALEAWRSGFPSHFWTGEGKPEGWGVELIDAIIRILDALCEAELNVAELLTTKMDYNKTRPYRHGGKRI